MNKQKPAVMLEVASAALQGLLYPFGVKPRPVKPLGPGHSRPVVLVHGLGGNRSCFLPLEGYMRLQGFDRTFPFNLGRLVNLDSAAASLQGFVDQVRNCCRAGRETIDLVAYSLGGLVARLYLQELGGARLVDQCISIATPHYGTYSSYWTPTEVGRQMRPDSEFLTRLNLPQRRAPGVRYHSIWADLDLMVLPREHAIYQEGDHTRIRGVGHLGVLVHPKTLQLVTERLRAGQDLPATRIGRAAHLAKSLLQKGQSVFSRFRAS